MGNIYFPFKIPVIFPLDLIPEKLKNIKIVIYTQAWIIQANNYPLEEPFSCWNASGRKSVVSSDMLRFRLKLGKIPAIFVRRFISRVGDPFPRIACSGLPSDASQGLPHGGHHLGFRIDITRALSWNPS